MGTPRPSYLEAQKAIKDHGGVYLGGGFEKTTNLTGGGSMSEPPPNRVVLIKFENADTAKKWWGYRRQENERDWCQVRRLQSHVGY